MQGNSAVNGSDWFICLGVALIFFSLARFVSSCFVVL